MKRRVLAIIAVAILSISSSVSSFAGEIKPSEDAQIYIDPTYEEYQMQLQSDEYYEITADSVIVPNELKSRASGSKNSYSWELVKFGSGQVYATGTSSTPIDRICVSLDTYNGTTLKLSQSVKSPSGMLCGAKSATDKDDVYRITNATAYFDFYDKSLGDYSTPSVKESWNY